MLLFKRFSVYTKHTKKVMWSLVLLALSVSFSKPCYALSIDINTVQNLDYGKFVEPVGGAGTIDVDKDGNLSASSAIQLLSIGGSGAITDINLKQASGTVHISMSDEANVSRLNFRRFAGTYVCSGGGCSEQGTFNRRQGRDFSVNIPSNGKVTLRLTYGARLRVRKNVATGIQQPSYTISINHE